MVNVMMSSLFFRDLQLTFLINWPVLFNPHLVLSKAYLWRVRFDYIIPALCETHITWCQRPRPRITPLTRSNDIAHQIDRSLLALPTSTDTAALEGIQPTLTKKIWFALKALPWSESTWQQTAARMMGFECSSVWLLALLDLDLMVERVLEQFEHFDGARYWGSLNKLKGNLVWKEKKQDLGLVVVIGKLAVKGRGRRWMSIRPRGKRWSSSRKEGPGN